VSRIFKASNPYLSYSVTCSSRLTLTRFLCSHRFCKALMRTPENHHLSRLGYGTLLTNETNFYLSSTSCKKNRMSTESGPKGCPFLLNFVAFLSQHLLSSLAGVYVRLSTISQYFSDIIAE